MTTDGLAGGIAPDSDGLGDIYLGEGDHHDITSLSGDPTRELYPEFQHAYTHFNDRLFDGKLPPVLITLQRKNKTEGYWSTNRFSRKDGSMAGELAMNPRYLAVRSLEETLSVLVHQQVHIWQTYFGKPGRRGYHNREWADKMKAIGLHPSNTDAVGGDETGESMGHYIVEDGAFAVAAQALIEQEHFAITWYDRFPAPPLAITKRPVVSAPAPQDEAKAVTGETAAGHPSESEPRPHAVVAHDPAPQDAPVEEARPHTPSVAEMRMGAQDDTPARLFPALGLQMQGDEASTKRSRVKFQCAKCRQSAWGKPSLQISCTPCGECLQAQ